MGGVKELDCQELQKVRGWESVAVSRAHPNQNKNIFVPENHSDDE